MLLLLSFAASNALHFNGSGPLEVPDAPALHLVKGLTLEAWVRPDPGVTERMNNAYFLSRNYGNGGYGMLIQPKPPQAGRATGWLPEPFPNGRLPEGRWSHVAYVTNNRISRLFVNGKLAGTQSFAGGGSLQDTELPLLIGGSPFGAGAQWVGALAEVRVWCVPRSGRQIGRTMRRRLRGTEKGLAAYFPFSEGEGNRVADRTGHTVGGKLPEGASWVEGPPI